MPGNGAGERETLLLVARGQNISANRIAVPLLVMTIGLVCLPLGILTWEWVILLAGPVVFAIGVWLASRWWRWREAPVEFEVHEQGIFFDGTLRPFGTVASASMEWAGTSWWTRRHRTLWVRFSDGKRLGAGPWLRDFQAVQAAILERLPGPVRAALEDRTIRE